MTASIFLKIDFNMIFSNTAYLEASSGAQGSLLAVRSVAAPVREQVVNSIRTAIRCGELKAGQRLVERELCSLLEVSRPSVREALRQLEAEGLIENIANKGPVIRTLTWSDAESILQIRGVLESLAVNLFVARASDEEVSALESVLRECFQAAALGEIPRVMELVEFFYDKLITGSGNPVLPGMLSSIHSQIVLYRRLCAPMPDRMIEGLKELGELVDAIKSRSPSAAAAACLRHIDQVARATLSGIPVTKP